MTANADALPESWLSRLNGRDASGWLTAFVAAPEKAVSDLLWDAFYFGPLNLTERGQLLAGWLSSLGNEDQFANSIDRELTDWVVRNWGQFDHPVETLISAWSCLCGVVEFSSRLSNDSQLKLCAAALRDRFAERTRFLGSFSTAPAADPLGLYLSVIAQFQGDDRSLATFWHQMCDLPDEVPFYHARYALLGLRRLKATDPAKNGTLQAEVVLGLFRLARSFDRLAREHELPDNLAKATFHRLAARTAFAYPNSPGWVRYGLAEAPYLSERAQRWLGEAIPSLAKAMEREHKKTAPASRGLQAGVQPDPSWYPRATELATRLKNGDWKCLPAVEQLLDEERHYAELTGEPYAIVRSLSTFASRVLRLRPDIALTWAHEALGWAPRDPFTWTTIKNVLLKQENTELALCFVWVAWKRFPADPFSHTGLAEVLKAVRRLDAAEQVYRETIRRFPDNPIARTGLADVLMDLHRYDEALDIYRKTAEEFPDDIVARTALAEGLGRTGRLEVAETEYRQAIQSGRADGWTYVALGNLLLRKSDANNAEVLQLIEQALILDPGNAHARRLKQQLTGESEASSDENLGQEDQITYSAPEPAKDEGKIVSVKSTESGGNLVAAGEPAIKDGAVAAGGLAIEEGGVAAGEPAIEGGAVAAGEPAIEAGTVAPHEPAIEADTVAPREPAIEAGTVAPREPAIEAGTVAPREPAIEAGTVAPREPAIEAGAVAPREPAIEAGTVAPREPAIEAGTVAPREPAIEAGTVAPREPAIEAGAVAPREPAIEAGTVAPREPAIEAGTVAPREPAIEAGTVAPREPAIAKAPVVAGKSAIEGLLKEASNDESQPFVPTDALQIMAFVAEAYFYRTWAKSAGRAMAKRYRNRSKNLLQRAQHLSPHDPMVLAEVTALDADDGRESIAYENLEFHLTIHPAALSLLVLKARLERERARRQERPMSDAALAELCSVPNLLRDVKPTLRPLYHFQRGLASLSLTDGMVRLGTAAQSFSKFRRALANRATEEGTEQLTKRNVSARTEPLFYQWLQAHTNRYIFVGLAETTAVQATDIPAIENALATYPSEVIALEDALIDRISFSLI